MAHGDPGVRDAAKRTTRDGLSVLTINAKSSSIRFAVYVIGGVPRRLLAGSTDAIGSTDEAHDATAKHGGKALERSAEASP